ncbi:hypothetical protein CROQUDRAFT_652309 [Cronartium quercuum f. sp. fusiforme G11]|uniref:Uncharacterized protein n=1 Tax=Cronartium quercuum f. sp. fusiforme G11 TaxID=708437 RepID=A0A9P6NNI1_9BASI|nr:hypothetical protein CROQUDRAFT_652309 [Cronartium quercuum f. sp. fusiforme G11]
MSNAAANDPPKELNQALSLESLYSVAGLVAVVTGGGTGLRLFSLHPLSYLLC